MNTSATLIADLEGQAQKAEKDEWGNIIASTYISSVSYDSETQEITFSSADSTKVITIALGD